MKKTLLEQTRELMNRLDLEPAQVRAVCAELGKSTKWYQLVQDGKTGNPGILTIEKLHKILTEMHKEAA